MSVTNFSIPCCQHLVGTPLKHPLSDRFGTYSGEKSNLLEKEISQSLTKRLLKYSSEDDSPTWQKKAKGLKKTF